MSCLAVSLIPLSSKPVLFVRSEGFLFPICTYIKQKTGSFHLTIHEALSFPPFLEVF